MIWENFNIKKKVPDEMTLNPTYKTAYDFFYCVQLKLNTDIFSFAKSAIVGINICC